MKKVKTPKKTLWKAIRCECLKCAGSPSEVALCTSPDCSLYEFRYGRAPKNDDLIFRGDGKYGKFS